MVDVNWLIEHVPVWLWAVPGAGLLFLAWRFAGFRAALVAAAGVALTMLTGGAFRKGLKTGSAGERAKQDKANEKAVKDYERIEAETGRMSDDALDAANDPWVRNRSGKR